VVLGNGPSLRGLDLGRLSGVHTLGMNAAYRHWDRIGWYPDLYVCLDDQVIETHHAEIRRLHRDGRIGRFFLHGRFFEHHPDLAGHPAFVSLDQVVARWYHGRGLAQGWEPLFQHPAFRTRGPQRITTGAHAVRFAAFLGFGRIALAGIDLRYVEQLPEAEAAGGIALVMRETPAHNPNYFFDDYQRAGDRFNLPNPEAHGFELHPRAFATLAGDLAQVLPGVEVVNTSPASLIAERGMFPLRPLDEVLAREAADPAPPPAPQSPPAGQPAPQPAPQPDAPAEPVAAFEAAANAPLRRLRRLGQEGGPRSEGEVVFGRHIVPGLWFGADTERGRHEARFRTGPDLLLEAGIRVLRPGRWLTLTLAIGAGPLPAGALLGVVCDLEVPLPAPLPTPAPTPAPRAFGITLRSGMDWGFADLPLSETLAETPSGLATAPGMPDPAVHAADSRLRVALATLPAVLARPARWRNLILELPQQDGRLLLRGMRLFLAEPPQPTAPPGPWAEAARAGTRAPSS